MTPRYTIIDTDWGYAGMILSEHGVRRMVLPLPERGDTESSLLTGFPDARFHRSLHSRLESQIQDYFAGTVRGFTPDIPMDLTWATPFTAAVLRACRAIAPGETRSYGQLARSVKRPRAARAVGGVMARNPIPLLIPCHRVLNSQGRLTGFSAPGGLQTKQRMLDLERSADTVRC